MKLTGRLQETGRHLQASRFRIQILATLPLLSISCKRQPEASDGKNWAWPNADRRNVVYGALLNGEARKGFSMGRRKMFKSSTAERFVKSGKTLSLLKGAWIETR
jgi:hypothetical protein